LKINHRAGNVAILHEEPYYFGERARLLRTQRKSSTHAQNGGLKKFNKCYLFVLSESGGLFSKSKKQTANVPSVSDSMFIPVSRTDLGGFLSSTTDTTIYPDDGPLAPIVQDNIR